MTPMQNWNSKLIDAYRILSWPYRQSRFRKMVRRGKLPIFSLFYHNVADDPDNSWTISRAEFQRQIDWVQANFDVVDLEECQRRIRSGFNDRPTLSITFDDGYAANCDFALPMLIERNIPVTYFVTTQHTINQEPFPHDVELQAPLPTNNLDSLRALAKAGVEVAAHTRTHLDLGQVTDESILVDEVLTACTELEQAIGHKLRYFAFPYGQHPNLNPRVFAMLREAGFLGVCSAYGGWNDIGGDEFHLQRIHGDPNFSRMKNWLTFDPRLANIQRYQYQSLASKKPIPSTSPASDTESRRTNVASPTSHAGSPPAPTLPTIDHQPSATRPTNPSC